MVESFTKKISSLSQRRLFAPLGLFLASLALYACTLPRTVSFEDSAEFVTAAATLGIPHPSGYPLYVLLAHVFTWLPFGSIPWRVALFSAVCAAAAVALAFSLARRLAGRLGAKLTGLVQAGMAIVFLQVAVSEIWWSQAIYAKVYPLHVLLLLSAAWALARFSEDPARGRWLLAAAFLSGLACANHLFLALAAAPFFLWAALAADEKLRRPSKRWIYCLLALAAGLLPYVYLPIRAAMNPPYSMDAIGSLREFMDYVLRRRYHDLALSAWKRSGLNFVLLGQLAASLGPLLFFLALAGAARAALSRDRLAKVILIGCLGGVFSAPLAVLARATDWTDTSAYMARVYGLAAYVFAAILAAAGAAWLMRRSDRPGQAPKWAAALALFALLPAATLAGNWQRVAPYRSSFVEAYGRELLGSLEPRAVLVVNDASFIQDTELYVLAYLQTVEGRRRDVTVVQDAGLNCFLTPDLPFGYTRYGLDMRRRLLLEAVYKDPRLSGRPIYATFAPEYVVSGLAAASNGLAFKLAPKAAGGGQPVRVQVQAARPLELPPADGSRSQMALGLVVSHVLYNRAAFLVETRGNKEALDALVAAIGLDTAPMSDDFRSFLAHRAAVTAGD